MRLETPRVAPLPVAEMDAEIRERLGDGPVLNIFRTLANHPKLMKRWLVFGNHVLGRSTLPPRERELVILRIGWLCRSGYEWGQHVGIALGSGLSQAEIDADPAGRRRGGLERARARAAARDRRAARRRLHLERHLGGARRAPRHPAADGSDLHGRPVQPGVDGAQFAAACSRSRACPRSRSASARRGSAGSARWSSCRARARARPPPRARARCGSRAACRARRPTDRRHRCPRARPA